MAILNFQLTDTRTATPQVIADLNYDTATQRLTIDCSNSIEIPVNPTNCEQVLLGFLKDLEIAAINKTYNPDYPISEPLAFNNPDFTSLTNFQYAERRNNEDETVATLRESQTIYAFKFVGWFQSSAPTAANAVNNDD